MDTSLIVTIAFTVIPTLAIIVLVFVAGPAVLRAKGKTK